MLSCRPVYRLLSSANRLHAISSIATCSTSNPNAADTKKIRSIDDKVQEMVSKPLSNTPTLFLKLRSFYKLKFGRTQIDPAIKSLLDGAAAQLYYNCANDFDYEGLRELFGLPDYLSTWYKLTLLHVWMVLFRMHAHMDVGAYERFQRSILTSMWYDVDERLKVVSKELKTSLTAPSDMKKMHNLHLQTFFEYDEGFLSSDAMLAAAVWRCFYMKREFDPIRVFKVVTYIRSTIAWLDTQDVDDILTNGIKEWKHLKSSVESSE
ncbi:hypothetical protein WR25_15297 [Diploscapter pachys]|uniref:Ubiquinol-cytochrome c chaperone domain-containing protein n=1 Tax=Diploscapter pachys TaxID=2018661 RepID=A0A2A2KFS8_9BILA|nr:hypothetical protein WR25_15297 [Diploscapter pachys]